MLFAERRVDTRPARIHLREDRGHGAHPVPPPHDHEEPEAARKFRRIERKATHGPLRPATRGLSAPYAEKNDPRSTPLPKLSRIWWTPLAFVIATLLLLLVMPLFVEHRVERLRDRLQNGSEHGRLLLNDLEAAFASQMLVGPPQGPADTTAIATQGHVFRDEAELRETMARVSPEASTRFGELYTLIRLWYTRHRTFGRDSTVVAEAREIFQVAESLDQYLSAESNAQRDAVRRIERFNLFSAVVLAPIALFAVVVVIRSGSRTVAFANAAEQGRQQVLRAAEARASLLRGVTHDVKNPLGAAAGYAQLLGEGIAGELTQQQLEMVARIRRLVDQSVGTVADLLELARADSGGLQLEYARAELGTLAKEVVDDHRAAARERQIALDFAGPPTPIVTDPRRVRQVLGNLLSNAIKYTPPGGTVHVGIVHDETRKTRLRVGVRVQDNGPGIPAQMRARIFDEFFRVSPSDSAVGGTGLGLAISQKIAHLLGGEVTFQPADPHGAVFTLWLDGSAPRDTNSSKG